VARARGEEGDVRAGRRVACAQGGGWRARREEGDVRAGRRVTWARWRAVGAESRVGEQQFAC
jgi:hypothetical protein